MRTQRVGRLEIDWTKADAEIEKSARLAFSDAYSEYLCGGPWKSCMLWAAGGDRGDGLVTNYDFTQRPAITEYGRQLPYLSGLVERYFNLDFLNFARLAVISNSVIIPHRDLLELGEIPEKKRNAHRLHLPLLTNEHCFFMEENTVYRMRAGEAWFFDASCPHSAASFSQDKRVHLMLDFSDVDDGRKLLRFMPEKEAGIPTDSICTRRPMSSREHDSLLTLSGVIDLDNYRDIFAVLIKRHYRRDGGDNFIWKTFLKIAKASGNRDLYQKACELHRYFLIERAA
ncbi:MAG TPA: aspartyl/asparaginyl beta-hydroxylase domain-containing protein [Acidobacteriota bacterium]|nr:aspartyl/asparaginyl beta-hydroxylase domain-containing protein [Acidobacteriota bacterium]